MSHPNYGKDFEHLIKTSILKVPDVDVQRLYDTTNGYVGVKQPSDFIVYKYPHQYYLECKCTWENTFHKGKITQLPELFEKQKTKGVNAGVIIWFISHDVTAYIPAATLSLWFENHSSINVKDLKSGELNHLDIVGHKKRIFFDYDFSSFFQTYSVL